MWYWFIKLKKDLDIPEATINIESYIKNNKSRAA